MIVEKSVKLSLLSEYRTQLMGLATIMIIACHAPASGVAMPTFLRQILGLGNFGVGVFFFLSGLGCWYSLNKESGGGIFLKRRFIRIMIPYLIIFIPYNILLLFLVEGYSLVDCLLSLTTVDFWLYHRGAWFVAALIPLYLSTPFFFKAISGNYRWAIAISIIVVLMIICMMDLNAHTNNDVIHNIQWVFQRISPFILGMLLAKDCKDGRSISIWWIIAVTAVYLGSRILGLDELSWLLVPLFIFSSLLICQLAMKSNAINSAITFMGVISLESYLLNISLNKVFGIIAGYIDSPIFYGRYLEYSMVIILGIILAYFANKLSQRCNLCIVSKSYLLT